MQSDSKTKPTVSLRLPRTLLQQVDNLVRRMAMRSRTEFIERAVESYVEELKEAKIVRVRTYSETDAQAAILRHLEEHPISYVSDLAEELAMDIDLAFRVVASLAEEGRVVG